MKLDRDAVPYVGNLCAVLAEEDVPGYLDLRVLPTQSSTGIARCGTATRAETHLHFELRRRCSVSISLTVASGATP